MELTDKSYQEARQAFRKSLNLDPVKAVLGNADGLIYDTDDPASGLVYVRYPQGTDQSFPAKVRGPIGPMRMTPGRAVWLKYDEDGKLRVDNPDFSGHLAAGGNPLVNNPFVGAGKKQQQSFTTLLVEAFSGTTIRVKAWAPVIANTVYLFRGATIDLGSGGANLIPSAGNKRYVVVFVKSDYATLEAKGSTAITLADRALDETDIQECLTAKTAGSTPVWAIPLQDNQSEITQADIDAGIDLRNFVNTTDAGVVGSGVVTSVGLSASPSSIFDVSGSPVTSTGTLALSLDTQSANTVLAGPSTGAAATPGFRALVDADIPVALAGHTITGGTIDNTVIGGTTRAAGGFTNLTITAGGYIRPSADSTSALLITKADGTTAVATIDTTNGHIGIGIAASSTSVLIVNKTFTNPALAAAATLNAAATMTGDSATNGIVQGGSMTGTMNQAGFNMTAGGPGAARGFTASAIVSGASGTVTFASAFATLVRNTGGGTLTSGANLYVLNGINSGGGTFGTLYGVFIENQTIGSTANYAIFTNSGLVRLGDQLQILGSANRIQQIVRANATQSTNLREDQLSNGTTIIGSVSGAGVKTVAPQDAGTNAVLDALVVNHDSSGTPAANYGTGVAVQGKSSTTSAQGMSRIRTIWTTATHASRATESVWSTNDSTGERDIIRIAADGSNAKIGVLGAAPAVRQTSGANLTNNVTAGGTDDTIANFTDLTIYANDAATIRNDIYQLARKLKQVNDALRLFGWLT